jgi:ABC-type Na+ efflux pump permease subunit
VLGFETDTFGKLVKDATGNSIPIYSQTSWFTGMHPFLALRTIFHEKGYLPPELGALPANLQDWPVGWYLSNPAGFFITFMFALSLLLVTPSVIFLRRLAQSNFTFRTWVLTKLHLSSGDRTRKPRTVWNNPIAWREARTKASAARASLLRYGFMAAGLAGALVLVVRFSQTDEPAQYIDRNSYNADRGILTVYNKNSALRYPVEANSQVTVKQSGGDRQGTLNDLNGRYAVDLTTNGPQNILASITLSPIPRKVSEEDVRDYLLGAVVLEFAVVLLIVTNAAASTVTREKEDGSLDLLLTTPITSRYYIWGKLSGLVGFVLPLVAVPVLSVLLFVIYDFFRVMSGGGNERWIAYPESMLILPAVLIIVAAFAAILGMHMSLRCRSTVMAVMSSVGIVVGICSLLGYCGYSLLNLRNGAGPIALVVGSFSPFTVLTVLINPYHFAEHAFDETDALTNRLVIFFSSFVAVAAYTAIVWAMYKSMVKNFDMTIRKQSR